MNNQNDNESLEEFSEPAIKHPSPDELLDVAIIGAGIAGASAAIHSGRYMMKTAIFAALRGGAIIDSTMVENYPGFIRISGYDLMQRVLKQASYYGALIIDAEIKSIEKQEEFFLLKSASDEEFRARQIIIATGTHRRRLGLPKEEKFFGRGISHCATCDAFFYKDKVVAVVGGSNTAAFSAMLLSKYASKVYLIYRRDKLRCEPYWRKLLEEDEKVEIVYNANVVELIGEQMLQGVRLDNGNTINIDGLFVEIGSEPSSDLAKSIGVETDESGYIIVDEAMRTNIPGVYSAGDVNTGSAGLKQLIVGASEGAIAASSAYDFHQRNKKNNQKEA
ncbi:MAG: thioredoxin reductase [Candidatus Woesearchaeota archaeon]|nr:thioredoxin reductase [Candidatus Woesearchaeota archaeon]